MRLSTILWLGLAGIMGTGLFYLKYDVQVLERTLERLNVDIAEDRRAIHVLKAEWSYLNQPDRLSDLSRRHLSLAPLARRNIVRLIDLPLTFDAGAQATPKAGPAAMGGSEGRR